MTPTIAKPAQTTNARIRPTESDPGCRPASDDPDHGPYPQHHQGDPEHCRTYPVPEEVHQPSSHEIDASEQREQADDRDKAADRR